MTITPTDPAQGLTPTATDPQGQTPNPQGLTPTGQKTSIDSLPVDIQDYIKSLRSEAKTLKQEKEAEIAAKKQAEDAALAEQGKFKELAEQHGKRVQELEPIAERYTALSTLISGQIKAQIKDWPAEIKAFDPGEDAPIEQRLAWIEKSRPIIERLQGRARQPGNSPGPAPSSGELPRDQQKQAFKARRSSSGAYGL